MTVGERIHKRRTEIGLSVDELAEQIGKNRATVYRYENNDIENLTLPIIKKLSSALKTTPIYLMGWEAKQDDLNNAREVTDMTATVDLVNNAAEVAIVYAKRIKERAVNRSVALDEIASDMFSLTSIAETVTRLRCEENDAETFKEMIDRVKECGLAYMARITADAETSIGGGTSHQNMK